MERRRIGYLTSLLLIASFVLSACADETYVAPASQLPPPSSPGSATEPALPSFQPGNAFGEVREVFPALSDWEVATLSFTSGRTHVDVFEFSPENIDLTQLKNIHQSFASGLLQGKSIVAEFDGQQWDVASKINMPQDYDVFIVPDNVPPPAPDIPFGPDTRAMTWDIDRRQPLMRSIIEVTPPSQNDYLKDMNANLVYNAATELYHATMTASAFPHGQKIGISLVDPFKAQEAGAMSWGLAMAAKAQGINYRTFADTFFGMTITVPYTNGSGSFQFKFIEMQKEDFENLPSLKLIPQQ